MKRILPQTSAERKEVPLFSGLLKYFPRALAEVAKVSFAGNRKHAPGQPLQWVRGKSADHEDALMRHLVDRMEDPFDPEDGGRQAAKIAWRALATLELELEAAAAEKVDDSENEPA